MHELSVTHGVLDAAIEKAKEAQATRINLVVGELSNITDECVQLYFTALSGGSIASGVTLSFKRVSAQMRCHGCGLSFVPDGLLSSCPRCGEGMWG